jgi:hypothetical protein
VAKQTKAGPSNPLRSAQDDTFKKYEENDSGHG